MNSETSFENKLEEIVKKYTEMFEYKKMTKEDYINETGFISWCEDSFSKKYVYCIVIKNLELVNHLIEIFDDPDLYDTPAFLTSASLYFGIHNLRIKYQDDKYHNDDVKKILDFTEELFENKYNKIEMMIKKGIVNFSSLWYYFDYIDHYYVTEHFNSEEICYKHKYFNYRKEGKEEALYLYGEIIYPDKGKMKICEYNHTIKKYSGIKKLSLFKTRKMNSDDEKNFIVYGNKIIDLYKNIHHLHLDGKFYSVKNSNIYCLQQNCRIIVDYEGMDKYANSPFDFTIENEICEIDETDRVIILPFVGIYSLGINKKWGVTHVKYLNEIIYQCDAFDYLALEDNKKSIIKCLINQKSNNYSDFIKGKGDGLIFLLYGDTGTGKSFTVEATCEYLKKPLYRINIGDLGTDPENMESIMNIVLDYAQRWKAIVMIDEVDIFLEERESSSITRNAMVGVFLKLMEYYNGIIFLTTNRLNSLDPAVKSRINLLLSYEPLNMKKRASIWKALFEKWKIEVNDQFINILSVHKLNGREIRNYIKIVFSILKDKKLKYTPKNIIKTLNDCFAITKEFDSKLKSTPLYI